MAGNVTASKKKKNADAPKRSGGSSGKQKQSAKKNTGSSSGRKTKQETQAKSDKKPSRSVDEMNEYQDHLAFEQGMILLVFCALAILCYISFLGLAGRVGTVIGGGLFGLFGWLAWLMPTCVVLAFIFSMVNPKDKRVLRKIISAMVALFALMGLSDLLIGNKILTDYYQQFHKSGSGVGKSITQAFAETLHHGKWSGGVVGRGINHVFTALLGNVGSGCVLIALLLIAVYAFYGMEWMAMLRKRNAYYKEMGAAYEVIRQEEDYTEPSYQVRPPKNRKKLYSDRKMQSVNLQQMNDQIDRQEAEDQRRKVTSMTSDKKNGMEEILPARGMSIDSGIAENMSAQENLPVDDAHMTEVNKAKEVSHIPIYREELQRKFGDGNASDADGDKRPLSETITSSLRSESSMELSEEDLAELAEELEDSLTSGTVVGKPMNSFAPKEEVTDVTPSTQKKTRGVSRKKKDSGSSTAGASAAKSMEKSDKEKKPKKPYQFPPIEMLSVPKDVPGRISDEELRNTASRLQETLQSFNVNVSMGAVTCGPTVTRYEVLPEQGVRVNKITNLADDLKLSLAAASIRIEAPIPGKAAVGIEVPNPESSPVFFRELLEGNDFKKAKSPVTFAVGKDIAGKRIMTDIAKMPHLLIAGATGSGKSVCINTLIMSILYKADPSDVKLIMIDPKVVELSVYNGIPHLFCPVVTDPKEAAASLNWAVREMMERYNKFKELGVRNITGYNQKIQTVDNTEGTPYEKMPSLVIIVDEFADLMMVASKEVEDAVCRLAQLARAAGIHLVLATQRPSVNVITGVIKANIPSRIAFSVSSAIDSRTILDKSGAEKLIGKGDMLFFPSGESEPVRVQGAFVSDKEVSDVVDFLREANEEPEYNHAVTEFQEEADTTDVEKPSAKSDEDEYFADAGRFVIESQRAAAGQLQRRFSIGFNRAGRIIDQLHKAGVVGPAEGTKPRKVIMSMEEFEQYLLGGAVSQLQPDDMLESVEREVTATEDPMADLIDSLD
ncbi:MAG: DNA translocase FtsK 4TM domain-containing protein [Lachnospiraceae bacterium]|nr:DNA translocase FtsK 4TM domain-containing protein [Lachnospiraceae bacterium]